MKNIIASLLLICGVCLAGQANAQHKNCPNVAGHYRVAGFGPVLGDALKVWGAEMAGFTDSEVKIAGNANQSLSLFLKSGNSGAMSSTPNRIWRINVNYRCDSGTIVFMQTAASARQLENGWYEGKTEIRIAPDSSRGLAINAFFPDISAPLCIPMIPLESAFRNWEQENLSVTPSVSRIFLNRPPRRIPMWQRRSPHLLLSCAEC